MITECATPSKVDGTGDISTHTIELSPMVKSQGSEVPPLASHSLSITEQGGVGPSSSTVPVAHKGSSSRSSTSSSTLAPPCASTAPTTRSGAPLNQVNGNDNGNGSSSSSDGRRSSARRSSSFAAVEDRLLSMGQAYRERQQEARLRAAQERAAAEAEATRSWKERLPPHHLNSSSFGVRLSKSEEDGPGTESQRSSVSKREQLLRAIEEEEAQRMTWKPKVCPKSVQLAEKKKREEQTAGLSAADVLMERKRQADRRLEALRRKEEEKFTFVPRVTARAREVELPMTATERLYEHAKERERENAALAEAEAEAEATWIGQISPFTTSISNSSSAVNELFKPSISQRAAKLTRKPGHSVHDDLYLFARSRIEERAKASEYHDPACTFKPKVNATSEHIAATLGETSASRLLKPRQVPVSDDVAVSDKGKKKSASSSARRRAGSALSLYDRQQLWLELKRKKILEAQMLQEVEMESECTFRPAISAKGRMAYTTEADPRLMGIEEEREHFSSPPPPQPQLQQAQEDELGVEFYRQRGSAACDVEAWSMETTPAGGGIRPQKRRGESTRSGSGLDPVRIHSARSSALTTAGGLRLRPSNALNEMCGTALIKPQTKYPLASVSNLVNSYEHGKQEADDLVDADQQAFFDILAELERPRTIDHLL